MDMVIYFGLRGPLMCWRELLHDRKPPGLCSHSAVRVSVAEWLHLPLVVVVVLCHSAATQHAASTMSQDRVLNRFPLALTHTNTYTILMWPNSLLRFFCNRQSWFIAAFKCQAPSLPPLKLNRKPLSNRKITTTNTLCNVKKKKKSVQTELRVVLQVSYQKCPWKGITARKKERGNITNRICGIKSTFSCMWIWIIRFFLFV